MLQHSLGSGYKVDPANASRTVLAIRIVFSNGLLEKTVDHTGKRSAMIRILKPDYSSSEI